MSHRAHSGPLFRAEEAIRSSLVDVARTPRTAGHRWERCPGPTIPRRVVKPPDNAGVPHINRPPGPIRGHIPGAGRPTAHARPAWIGRPLIYDDSHQEGRPQGHSMIYVVVRPPGLPGILWVKMHLDHAAMFRLNGHLKMWGLSNGPAHSLKILI